MTIEEARNLLESLKARSVKKQEIKVYEKFLHTLNQLNSRTFSGDEMRLLETEIDRLNLASSPENKKKYFRRALSKFEEYLKQTFSLTPKAHYTTLYGGLGVSFGLLFGVVFLSSWDRSMGIALGISLGLIVGSTIGQFFDAKAKKENKML